jgi:bifunctional DNA-binding transcriptional regulator/antitoxin component of YhaV-PrlF toxin-antitoxin module
MEMTVTKLHKDGRLTIPAEIRHQLGFSADAELVLVADASGLHVHKRGDALQRVRAQLAATMGDKSLVDEYLDDKRQRAKAELAEDEADTAA